MARLKAELGIILDPANVKSQLTGGAIEPGNFPNYDAMRMLNAPRFHVEMAENNTCMGGVGEIDTPHASPAAPALANALFDLTGQRTRALPLSKMFDFVS